MGFDDGRIILDSATGAYYVGQKIYGRIVFDQGKVKTIHGIYVDVKGFCKVHWTSTETRRVNDRTEHHTVTHESHEEYFRNKQYIYGNASGEHHLQPGHHEFSFEQLIPTSCPSSFEGSHGHVRYRVKVVMHTSGMFTMNKDKMVPFRVIAPVDLNLNPYCKEPMELNLDSTYCCWCVSSGSSEISVRLPVGGYCPGQVISMDVSCKNNSTVEIDTIKFLVRKWTKYLAVSAPDTREESDKVVEIKKGPVPGGTTRNWTVEMEVPAMDIYNLNACRFIDIKYYFKVNTDVSGCHDGAEDVRDIIFGNIPLVGYQDNVPNTMQDQMPQAQVQNVTNAYPPPPIINQPLPQQPYTNGSPYTGVPPYPNTPSMGNSPYPNASPYPPNPFPAANPPYPGGPPQPYQAGMQQSSPYSQNGSPYPGSQTTPYPPGNVPYPTNTPYSTDNPASNLSPVPPYQGGRQSPIPPYPNVSSTTPLKTGSMGFAAQGIDTPIVPLLPPGANVPYPTSPYTVPSAPVPSTPSTEEKTPGLTLLPEANSNSPYNPEFMNNKTN